VGAGYLYLRRWRRVVPTWLATAALLFIALPAEAEGIAGVWAVLWALCAVAAAVDAWWIARPATPPARVPWIPATAGVLLLALPAAGPVWFDDARQAALEEDLRIRLEAADQQAGQGHTLDFGNAEDTYRDALDEYFAVRGAHPGTDAAAGVPARLDALYEGATADRVGEDHCAALAPLRFFRGLPGDFEDAEAERLAELAAGALPGPLHDCGLTHVEADDPAAAQEPLTELLESYPEHERAAALPDELGGRQQAAMDQLGTAAACPALDELRALNGLFEQLPGADFTRMAADGTEPVPEGLYQCGASRFLAGNFTGADESLNELIDDHPDHDRVDRARDILIASRIAAEYPGAGEELPPEPGTTGGPTVTLEIFNDSPYEMEALYTGPRTLRETAEPCDDCEVYTSDPGDNACPNGEDYPSITLRLPAGDYFYLNEVPNGSARSVSGAETLSSGYIYTSCFYVTEESLLTPDFDLPGLEDLNGIEELDTV
jgi:tetratricopeptide (TPR) repeat protein